MADFISAALPWVVLGVMIAVCIAFITIKKAKPKTSEKNVEKSVPTQKAEPIQKAEPTQKAESTQKTASAQGTSSACEEDENPNAEQQDGNYVYMSLGMLFGLCAGFLAGRFIPGVSPSIGMCMGLAVGLMFGSLIRKK